QVQQSVEEEESALSHYVSDSAEPVMKEVNKEGLLKPSETKAKYRQEVLNERERKWRAKALHGQYLKDTEDKIDKAKTWLTNGEMKNETEGLILAPQEQAFRTNAIKCQIDGTRDSSKCRLCNTKDETVDHLVSACSKIPQTDYKERHDKVAAMLYWNLCKKYSIPTTNNWWAHKVEKVLETNDVKILWDFKLEIDKHLAHNIPDITVIEKKQIWLVDVAIPGDSRITQK